MTMAIRRIFRSEGTLHTYQIEDRNRDGMAVIVERDFSGEAVNTLGAFASRRKAEGALARLADTFHWQQVETAKTDGRKRPACTPGKDCFNCPFPDCIRGVSTVRTSKKESVARKIGYKEKSGKSGGSLLSYGNASKLRGFADDWKVTSEVKTRIMPKAELEAMLAQKYGSKLEPVKESRKSITAKSWSLKEAIEA